MELEKYFSIVEEQTAGLPDGAAHSALAYHRARAAAMAASGSSEEAVMAALGAPEALALRLSVRAWAAWLARRSGMWACIRAANGCMRACGAAGWLKACLAALICAGTLFWGGYAAGAVVRLIAISQFTGRVLGACLMALGAVCLVLALSGLAVGALCRSAVGDACRRAGGGYVPPGRTRRLGRGTLALLVCAGAALAAGIVLRALGTAVGL